MALKTDRVGEFLEGGRPNRRVLISPEGIPLEIRVARHGERLTALVLDLFFMFVSIALLFVLMIALFFSGTNISVGMTLILFLAFIIRNLYFIHFELAWQGRTPGKRICGLRVINRGGGELLPSAIIARNLTREVELFLPISLFLSLGFSPSIWQSITLFGWVLAITLLPLFNKDHLRAGDLIGGTMVIAMPKRVLLEDLAFGRREVTLSPSGPAPFSAAAEQAAVLEPSPPGAPAGSGESAVSGLAPFSAGRSHHPSAPAADQAAPYQAPEISGPGQIEPGRAGPDGAPQDAAGLGGGSPEKSASQPSGQNPHPAGGQPAGPTERPSSPLAGPPARSGPGENYLFTYQQLSVYGTFELQVLEEFLRRPQTAVNNALLAEVCRKICRKINWQGNVPPAEVRPFLIDFYAAVRAELERGQLFGKVKADKNSGTESRD